MKKDNANLPPVNDDQESTLGRMKRSYQKGPNKRTDTLSGLDMYKMNHTDEKFEDILKKAPNAMSFVRKETRERIRKNTKQAVLKKLSARKSEEDQTQQEKEEKRNQKKAANIKQLTSLKRINLKDLQDHMHSPRYSRDELLKQLLAWKTEDGNEKQQ